MRSIRWFKITAVLGLLILLTSASNHKFYVSTTQMEYVEEKESLQIISKIFIEDIETVLQERYDPNISLATTKERDIDESFIKQYILKKLTITIDGVEVSPVYIGRAYDIDLVNVYLEVIPTKPFKSIEVENKILFESFPEQQNIVHLKCYGKRRSLILDIDNPKGLLNFN